MTELFDGFFAGKSVLVTSDKCYENREQIWGYREIMPWASMIRMVATKGPQS
jgi:hypothetical protein